MSIVYQVMEPAEDTEIKKWIPCPLIYMCRVCGAPATDVMHYGAISCFSCRAFFRRSVGEGKSYPYCSRQSGICKLDKESRTQCKKCRLQKCIKVGMIPERVDRIKKKHKSSEAKTKYDNFSITIDKSSELCTTQSNCSVIDMLVEECIHEHNEGVENKSVTDVGTRPTVLVRNPEFKLTVEEEFKINELLVRKENFLNECHRARLRLPNYLHKFETFLYSINMELSELQGMNINEFAEIDHHIRDSFYNGGGVKQAFNMFDGFPIDDDSIRREMFDFTAPILAMLFRSYLMGNRDKGYFISQHKAAGSLSKLLVESYDHIFPNDRHAIKSFDPRCFQVYKSPWAARYEDELFYPKTLETIGELVKDDTMLGTLYYVLALVTPGAKLSTTTRNNVYLKKTQRDILFLMYKYLKTKLGNNDAALYTNNMLQKLLGDLHICRDIRSFSFGFESIEISRFSSC